MFYASDVFCVMCGIRLMSFTSKELQIVIINVASLLTGWRVVQFLLGHISFPNACNRVYNGPRTLYSSFSVIMACREDFLFCIA